MLCSGIKNTGGDIIIVSLISAGIDSPVSSYLLIEHNPIFLHFNQKNSEKYVKEIIKVLGSGFKLFVVDHEELMEIVLSYSTNDDVCVYCKSGMLLFAEELAKKFGCKAIVTGDSLGQVASQTILNLKSEESLLEIPVVRPLVGMDKVEIVDIAKKIGTYDISIKFKEKCQYSPKHPITKGCNIHPDFGDMVKKAKFNVRTFSL